MVSKPHDFDGYLTLFLQLMEEYLLHEYSGRVQVGPRRRQLACMIIALAPVKFHEM